MPAPPRTAPPAANLHPPAAENTPPAPPASPISPAHPRRHPSPARILQASLDPHPDSTPQSEPSSAMLFTPTAPPRTLPPRQIQTPAEGASCTSHLLSLPASPIFPRFAALSAL